RALGEGVPVRHAAHPYDALVLAGADPSDVYVVEVREVAKDIDVDAMLEALHRSSPQAALVVLADEPPATLPAFVTRISRAEVQTLRALVVPGEAAAEKAPAAGEEAPRSAAAGGAR